MRTISEIILHCSATWSRQDIGVKEIRRWHTLPEPQGRGWVDIGYHYVIRRDGTLEKGRPLEKAGAHCSGHNAESIGICLVGGGPSGEDNNFTIEQFDTLAELIHDLRKKYPMASIHGHNEYTNKACPVFNVKNFLSVYGISKYPWDSNRWPHFRPSEFTGSGCPDLWGAGEIHAVWSSTLDNLELLRASYGKPLILTRTEWVKKIPVFIVDIKVPDDAKKKFVNLAMSSGFASARYIDNGVRVYMGNV